MYFEGELPVMSYGNCNNGNNSNSGWNDWSWIIGLALVGGLFGGWGGGFGGGFGGGRVGYGGGYGGVGENYVLATDFATIERKLDGVNNGLCDGFYAQNTNMLNGFASVQSALCQGFNGLQQTAMQGFHGVDNAVCNLGYNVQAGFNTLGSQLASCCCTIENQIMQNRFEASKNTCDIIRAGQDNTRAILDYLTNEKIEGLRAENVALKGQISNDRQSAYIVSQLKEPCPVPAYLTCDPRVPYNYGQHFNNNCGCGCN